MVDSRSFAGIEVSRLRLPTLLTILERALVDGPRLRVTFLNPDYARQAFQSPTLRRDINDCDLVLVDGNGVRLLAPLFGFVLPERLDTDSVAGPLFEVLARKRSRVFLFGCAPGVARAAGEKLAASYPGLVISGTEHGFYDIQAGHRGRFEGADVDRIVDEINASRTDFLLVSLPTPMQQEWVARIATRLDARIVMTGGSYLDHLAEPGAVAGAWYPRWVNSLRINWLYRLAREPKRLWRRYTVELAHYAYLVVLARMRGARCGD